MHCFKNSAVFFIFINYLFSLDSFALIAEERKVLYIADKPIISFQRDWSDSERALISYSEEAILFNLKTQEVLARYKVDCRGKVFAYPFFADIQSTCWINEATATIEKLNTTAYYTNSFYISYFGQDPDFLYFLFNARPWQESGSVYVKKINKDTRNATTDLLISSIPGYSGAMSISIDGKLFYYTAATGNYSNELFTLNFADLYAAINLPKALDFVSNATQISSFPGLSFDMSVSSEWFIYFVNSQYVVNRGTGNKFELRLPSSCDALGFWQDQLLAKCDESSIVLFKIEDLIK